MESNVFGLEGNPDRPIVIGSVYHGTNRPPYPLPDEKTQTTIKSNSSKGGGGFNEIRLQDKKGAEQVFIHGEKDFDLRVKNTRKEYIGNERHLTVEKDEFAQVKKSKHQLVTEDFLEKVGGDMHTTVGGDRVVHISGGDHLTIDGDFIMKIGGSTNIKSGKKVISEAGMEITLKAGDASIVIGPSGIFITGPMVKINSGGNPSTASLPDPPDEPKAAKIPVEARRRKNKAPEARKAKEKAVVLDSNKVKEYESVQAQTLSDATENGSSFLRSFDDPEIKSLHESSTYHSHGLYGEGPQTQFYTIENGKYVGPTEAEFQHSYEMARRERNERIWERRQADKKYWEEMDESKWYCEVVSTKISYAADLASLGAIAVTAGSGGGATPGAVVVGGAAKVVSFSNGVASFMICAPKMSQATSVGGAFAKSSWVGGLLSALDAGLSAAGM